MGRGGRCNSGHQRQRSPSRNGRAGIRMKMALRREKQVRHTTAGREKPLKTSVQVGSKIGKKLSELFEGVEATLPNGADRIEIQQVSCDSRKVEKGALFFALHGAKADGNTFIQDALKRGAVAVASEEPAPKKLPRGVAWVQVREERKALATTAANFFGHPANALQLVAVTGTNGKTTTTSLVDAIVRASGANFFGHPANALQLVAVTGTNGKTT